MSSWLWHELHDLFDTNDGSLPEIALRFSNSESMVQAFAILHRRAASILPVNPWFWSKIQGAKQPLDSVPNAASLVVSGEAEAFHIVCEGIKIKEVTIPALGVFVFADQIVIDYRMGAEWGAKELVALFELFRKLISLEPNASPYLVKDTPCEVLERFQKTWYRWLREHPS